MIKEFKIRFKEPMQAVRWDNSKIDALKEFFEPEIFDIEFTRQLSGEYMFWPSRTLLKDGDIMYFTLDDKCWNVISGCDFHKEFVTLPVENTEEST